MPLGLIPRHLGSRGSGQEGAEQEVRSGGGAPGIFKVSWVGWGYLALLTPLHTPSLSFLLGPGNCLCLLPCEKYPKWL